MLPAPFSGFQGGRRHPQADSSSGWAELEEGSPWGLVRSPQGLQVLSGFQFLPPGCTGLAASWSQEGSHAPDIWTLDAVGGPLQWGEGGGKPFLKHPV